MKTTVNRLSNRVYKLGHCENYRIIKYNSPYSSTTQSFNRAFIRYAINRINTKLMFTYPNIYIRLKDDSYVLIKTYDYKEI